MISLGHVIDEWLRVTEHEESTRERYLGYIERTITPALGSMSIVKLSVRHLETLYAEWCRCRVRCDGKPLIEHKTADEHDCAMAKCKLHVCKPARDRGGIDQPQIISPRRAQGGPAGPAPPPGTPVRHR